MSFTLDTFFSHRQQLLLFRMCWVLPHLEGHSARGHTAQLKCVDAPDGQSALG